MLGVEIVKGIGDDKQTRLETASTATFLLGKLTSCIELDLRSRLTREAESRSWRLFFLSCQLELL